MGDLADDRLKGELTRHVLAFVPAAEGEDLDQRIALLRARDFAALQVARRTDQLAYYLAREAHEVAGSYVYAEVPSAQLEIAVNLCRHLVQGAFLADHLATAEEEHVL